jgi:hypothetical protein
LRAVPCPHVNAAVSVSSGCAEASAGSRLWDLASGRHSDPHSAQLKAKDAKTFSSPELFWNVFKLLDMYDFKLPIRRSIHDLFQESRVADGFFQIWDELR